MSIERVRAYFEQFGMQARILEFPVSSATVELAAEAAGVPAACRRRGSQKRCRSAMGRMGACLWSPQATRAWTTAGSRTRSARKRAF